MLKRYRLTDCYALLQVDPKTFRRWIEKAGIEPQVSKADDRVKYLTQAQLEELATLHEKALPLALPHHEATINPGTYKLFVDQMEELQQEVAHAFGQTHEAWRTIDALRENYERELKTISSTLEEKSLVLQQLTDLQRQQHEALATRMNDQQQALDLQKNHQAEYYRQQEIRIDGLSHILEHVQQNMRTQLETIATVSQEQGQVLTKEVSALRDEMQQRIEAAQTQVQIQIAEENHQASALMAQISVFSTTQQALQRQVEAWMQALQRETEQRQVLTDQVAQLREEVGRLEHASRKSPRQRKTTPPPETKGQ